MKNNKTKKLYAFSCLVFVTTIELFFISPTGVSADHADTHNQTITATTISKLPGGVYVWGDLTVGSGGVLTHGPSCTNGITITANTITILSGGAISANGRGCNGGASGSPGTNGSGPGPGLAGNSGTDKGGGGGGHGGNGGIGKNNSGSGGSIYGSSSSPVSLGSGGGGSGSAGGAGGGALKFIVKDALTVDGTISANGVQPPSGGGGGGAGGSIWIVTGTLDGAGIISANGGQGGGGSIKGGGGGGGRVTAYYFSKSFSGTLAAALGLKGGGGGTPSATDGTSGTLVESSYGNVRGWAWSENIGWISFNCYNDLNPATPSITDHSCSTAAYGVHIDIASGDVTGYTWSRLGWISFNRADTGAPPTGQDAYYYASPDLARYESAQLRGWARALSVCPSLPCPVGSESDGWDGWINLNDDPGIPGPATFGPSLNLIANKFEGWAWGNKVLGWVSFNRIDCDPDEDGDTDNPPCPPGGQPIADYFVRAELNSAPIAYALAVSPGTYYNAENFCLAAPFHTFTWSFQDNEDPAQTAYRLQASTASDFSLISMDTGPIPVATAVTSRSPTVTVSPLLDQLGYGNTYWWRVQVYDSSGKFSPWTYPPSPLGTPTPLALSPSFDTAEHLYPLADFTYAPAEPSEGEQITFDSKPNAGPDRLTFCYDSSNNETACPAAAGNYRWDFEYVSPTFAVPPDAIGQIATTTYNDQSTHVVAFEITDAAPTNYVCRAIQSVTPQAPLPRFREAPPTSLFDRAKSFLVASVSVIRNRF